MIETTEYTLENAREALLQFLVPDEHLTQKEADASWERFEQLIDAGSDPRTAFESAMNLAYEGKETDEKVLKVIDEIFEGYNAPKAKQALIDVYRKIRENFCPYVAFQFHLSFIKDHLDQLDQAVRTEELVNQLIEQGVPEEMAASMARLFA